MKQETSARAEGAAGQAGLSGTAAQIMALDQAVLAAVLEVTGSVTVSREAINRCLREKTAVGAAETEGGFQLWLP